MIEIEAVTLQRGLRPAPQFPRMRIRPMVWVKLCGLRDVATAAALTSIAPDAVGLNFFERSVRYVSPSAAAAITQVLPATIARVGVFVGAVGARAREIAEIARQVGLTHVQFHGDETPGDLAAVREQLPGLPFIRSWTAAVPWERWPGYLAECRVLGVEIDAVLVDAPAPGVYGGTGQTVDWNRLRADYQHAVWPRLILAGGLRPENVAEAIRAVQPWGVDVASGIESAPGVKDLAQMAAFVAAARSVPDASPQML